MKAAGIEKDSVALARLRLIESRLDDNFKYIDECLAKRKDAKGHAWDWWNGRASEGFKAREVFLKEYSLAIEAAKLIGDSAGYDLKGKE